MYTCNCIHVCIQCILGIYSDMRKLFRQMLVLDCDFDLDSRPQGCKKSKTFVTTFLTKCVMDLDRI